MLLIGPPHPPRVKISLKGTNRLKLCFRVYSIYRVNYFIVIIFDSSGENILNSTYDTEGCHEVSLKYSISQECLPYIVTAKTCNKIGCSNFTTVLFDNVSNVLESSTDISFTRGLIKNHHGKSSCMCINTKYTITVSVTASVKLDTKTMKIFCQANNRFSSPVGQRMVTVAVAKSQNITQNEHSKITISCNGMYYYHQYTNLSLNSMYTIYSIWSFGHNIYTCNTAQFYNLQPEYSQLSHDYITSEVQSNTMLLYLDHQNMHFSERNITLSWKSSESHNRIDYSIHELSTSSPYCYNFTTVQVNSLRTNSNTFTIPVELTVTIDGSPKYFNITGRTIASDAVFILQGINYFRIRKFGKLRRLVVLATIML